MLFRSMEYEARLPYLHTLNHKPRVMIICVVQNISKSILVV